MVSKRDTAGDTRPYSRAEMSASMVARGSKVYADGPRSQTCQSLSSSRSSPHMNSPRPRAQGRVAAECCHRAGARTTAEFWPPIPSDVLSVTPSDIAVGPSNNRAWPGATVGGAGTMPYS